MFLISSFVPVRALDSKGARRAVAFILANRVSPRDREAINLDPSVNCTEHSYIIKLDRNFACFKRVIYTSIIEPIIEPI